MELIRVDDYTYGHKKDEIQEELCWNIFYEDVNAKEIVVRNIFNFNWVFTNSLIDIYNKHKKTPFSFEEFSVKVQNALRHEYWSRSEYETIITSWPPYIDDKELTRLVKERDERIAKGYKFYCEHCNLTIGEKIDVYDQILLNWGHFINYLWNNIDLIKKLKKIEF